MRHQEVQDSLAAQLGTHEESQRAWESMRATSPGSPSSLITAEPYSPTRCSAAIDAFFDVAFVSTVGTGVLAPRACKSMRFTWATCNTRSPKDCWAGVGL